MREKFEVLKTNANGYPPKWFVLLPRSELLRLSSLDTKVDMYKFILQSSFNNIKSRIKQNQIVSPLNLSLIF
jgi:hypothetical protein